MANEVTSANDMITPRSNILAAPTNVNRLTGQPMSAEDFEFDKKPSYEINMQHATPQQREELVINDQISDRQSALS